MFNTADIIVLFVIAVFVIAAYFRGIIKSVIGFASVVISIIASFILYPYASAVLRATPLFTSLKASIIKALELDAAQDLLTQKAQADLIGSLSLPDFMKLSLFENNNGEMYKLLDVSSITDYIGGYIAGIIINILSLLLVIVVVKIALSIIVYAFDIVSRLPVISTADKLLGAVFGFMQSIIFVWIIMTLITLFLTKPEHQGITESIQGSVIASKLYDSNIFIGFITKMGKY